LVSHAYAREAGLSDETIRTSMAKVIQDTAAPIGLRDLALEVLHWRLRERLAVREEDDASGSKAVA
jgi:hypothetical protein